MRKYRSINEYLGVVTCDMGRRGGAEGRDRGFVDEEMVDFAACKREIGRKVKSKVDKRVLA
jgi:hypothetical protein